MPASISSLINFTQREADVYFPIGTAVLSQISISGCKFAPVRGEGINRFYSLGERMPRRIEQTVNQEI